MMGYLPSLISAFFIFNLALPVFSEDPVYYDDSDDSNLTMSAYSTVDGSNVQLWQYLTSSGSPYVAKLGSPDCSKSNPSLITAIMIHGWQGAAANDIPTLMKNELIKKGAFNVYLVDYKSLAAQGYDALVADVPKISTVVASYITDLITKCGVKPDKLHLIGHSIGAHICGFSAKKINPTYGQVARITGLDAANPSFNDAACSNRLCSTDAKMVEALHTSDDLGMTQPAGSIDMYLNNGKIQPTCSGGIFGASCNHNSAPKYWAYSLNSPNKWEAQRCGSVAQARDAKTTGCTKAGCYMGYSTTCSPGVYSVPTTAIA